MDESRKAARAWTKEQTRLGRSAAMPAFAFGLVNIGAGIAQSACVAVCLAAALGDHRTRPALALAGFALLILLRAWLQYRAELAAFAAGAAGRRRTRADAMARLLAAGPALLRRAHSGELAATATDRVEALDGFFGRWVPVSLLALAGPLLVLISAIFVSRFAAIAMLCGGLFVPFGQAAAGIGAAAASRRQFRAMERLQARFLDRVRGIATIVLAGRADDEAKALAAAADELRVRTMRVLRVAFLSAAALDCAMAGVLIAIALHERSVLAGGHGSPLRAVFALLLVPEFFAPLRAFSAAYQDRLHAGGAAEALIALPALPPPPAPRAQRTIEARGVALAFEHITLQWDPARPPALSDLTFFVAPGEMILLTGPSGAGKSSVIELLLGFARPTEGRILINGHSIDDIVPAALSRLTAWIGQRPTLFAGTIRENIAFARPDATDAEIDDAARLARILDFADGLPLGLETRVGDGGFGLSGGQAQRVAIARAFLKDAPLLLLDEPTAHLDPATEADVLQSLKRLALGRTVVMATHSAQAHAFGGRRLDLRHGRATEARGAA